MPVEGLFSTTVAVLGKSIDLRARNQALIASNVANAETPNYTPKALSFEHELQGALKGDGKNVQAPVNARHFPLKGASSRIQSVAGKVIETPAKTPGKDGNSVEIEAEMSRMTENQIMYNASVQILAKKFEGLRMALREGK
ncbi:flagellar basal body rod protein FlgB [Pelotalea chapellei]|uniref:Flagellar basal body rod protein FlgB n=1 Tax=Pelotalea chapellei TaxID=44671 RepID=A0ABS5U8F9_9BACT|nr:flagellar basal body rod protein FlgB [Pelotalea chapellei]MBT1071955.1 flagellar basal body rod protein FlgB [Pelotalea chapellei]